jgi:hypothetical protein
MTNTIETRYPTASWGEFGHSIINNLDLKKTAQGEFHGPCPSCSGTDRFWIKEFQGEVMVNCRKCNDYKSIKDRLRDLSLWPEEGHVSQPAEKKTDIDWPERDPMSNHPYLEKKRINLHNAKIEGDRLIIPVIDATGRKVGSQSIDADGRKKFSYQLPVIGNFSVIGGPITDFTYIAEGWATAATVHEATGKPCVFALNAGNIVPVVEVLQRVKPSAELVIAGDNDAAGIKECERAFEEFGVDHLLPEQEGWDFSDLWIAQGPEATKKALTVESVMDQVFMPSDAIPQLSRNYLVKGWLGEGQMSVIYGPSNVGKSFFALDMSWHVSCSETWNGHKVIGGSVLYLATEGGMAFHNRVVALSKQYPDHKDVKLAVRPAPVNLLDGEIDMVVLEKLCREVSRRHGKVKLIVVDTLSRSMAGGNENSPEDMTRFIGNCDKMRNMTGAHVAIVHHSGKDKAAGARGHSSLRAATDTEIELDYDENTGMRTAKATKQRDMETGALFSFKLNVVDLGKDEDGDVVTTCTVKQASESEIEEANRPRIKGKNQVLIRQVFTQLRGEGIGKPNPAGAGFPEPRTYWMISEETVKDHFAGKVSSSSNPRSVYKQAMDALIGSGHAVLNDGFIWFTDTNGQYREPQGA